MSVLSRIRTSGAVTDDGETIPLRGAISAVEGAYLQQVIATHKPRRSLEIGLTSRVQTEAFRPYGVAFACATASAGSSKR